MSKLIVVMGATGSQGSSVVKRFLNEPTWKVRAVTRDSSKPTSLELKNKGVEVVQGDTNDLASLIAAFKGANLVFGLTDFWTIYFDPETQSKVAAGQTINEYCYSAEVSQGENLARALETTLETLDLFVWSSLPSIRRRSKGKYTWGYHFDSKEAIWDHIKANHTDLSAKTSILEMGYFMNNWKSYSLFAPALQPDGVYELQMAGNASGPQPWVVATEDTGKFVKGLETVGPGKTLLGYGSMLTGDEYMELWSRVLGVEGRYNAVSVGHFDKLVPGGLGREIGENHAYSAEFGYFDDFEGVLHPEDLGIMPITLEEYIRSEDWSPVVSRHEGK